MLTKEMSIGEIPAINEPSTPIMMGYGMHCLGCPVSQMETPEEGCPVHGMNPDELVNRLNQYLAAKA